MADEPPPPGQGGADRLPDWPQAPGPGASEGGGRPPSAPPPGWTGTTPPWAQPVSPAPPAPGGPGAPRAAGPPGPGAPRSAGPPGPGAPRAAGPLGPGHPGGRLAFLRSRRGMAIAGVAALLLVAAVVGFVVVNGGGSDGDAGGTSARSGGQSTAGAAAAGREVPLLDGRLIVVAPEGWEQRESLADTATFNVELRLPGRDLVATLVASALPPGGTLDGLLTADGGIPFEVTSKGAGELRGTVVPPTGNIRAGALRPNATFFLTLNVFALDGQPLDGPVLQKLFTDQVVPQIRIP